MHPVVLLTWLVTSTPSEAQTPAEDTATARSDAPAPGDPQPISEFLVVLKNGERIEGSDGALSGVRFTGTSNEGRHLTLLPDDIETLYRKDGSRAGPMALYGAGVGLAISGVSILTTAVYYPKAFTDVRVLGGSAAFIGGSTLLGALIGLAIGAGQDRWSVAPLVAPGQQYSLHLSHSL